MGTGDSGIYYSSHGSRLVGFRALIHSFDGKFIKYFKEISKEEWIDWFKEYLKENYS